MGYSKTIEYGDNFAIGGNIVNNGISTVPATSYAFGTITVPSDMKIKKVYLDLMIRAMYSDSVAADNQIVHAGELKASYGGSDYVALTIPIGSLYVVGTAMSPGVYFHGNIDVKNGFRSGSATTIVVDDWEANSNHLHLLDCQAIARVILY